MITNYYCNVCGKHGDTENICEDSNILNIINVCMDDVKYYYFCDDCAEDVLDTLSNMFNNRVQNSPTCERMTYQRFKELKGE